MGAKWIRIGTEAGLGIYAMRQGVGFCVGRGDHADGDETWTTEAEARTAARTGNHHRPAPMPDGAWHTAPDGSDCCCNGDRNGCGWTPNLPARHYTAGPIDTIDDGAPDA